MPLPLPDELLEEVLSRLPPHEPSELVRAAVVCRRWCRLVSGPGFRRRFREFHRIPPMLGMLCNRTDVHVARFVPTAAFCSPEADRGRQWRALDARHGRVLFSGKGNDLVVWDPITDEERVLPFPPQYSWKLGAWTAAVLCAAAATGACGHLDCHRRPFIVVFVGSVLMASNAGDTFICTYTSKTAAWTEPIYTEQPGDHLISSGSALMGNALYFVEFLGTRVLKYNLELHEVSWILLPFSLPHVQQSLLIATENGELGIATTHGSKLCIWLRKQDACNVGDEWKPCKAIKLKTLLPADASLTNLDVVGSVEGADIIFMTADDVVYTIDLKTYKTKKVYEGKINTIVPYMSFCTPALERANLFRRGTKCWWIKYMINLRCSCWRFSSNENTG